MAVTAGWYGQALLGQFGTTDDRRVDWAKDLIKVMLLANSHTLDQKEHAYLSDVDDDEIEGSGYTAGGEEIAERTASYDDASDTLRLDGGDVEWSGASFAARYAVVYKDQDGDPEASPVLGWVDFGEDMEVASGVFKIGWDSTDGVLRVSRVVGEA